VHGSVTRVTLGAVEMRRGSVANGQRVAEGMRAGVRACYERQLASEPGRRGTIDVMIDIGANGAVDQVRIDGSPELTSEMLDCVSRRVKSATFVSPEPDGSKATMAIRFVLDFG
jgi:outer membrane biosynthesis protein TonB